MIPKNTFFGASPSVEYWINKQYACGHGNPPPTFAPRESVDRRMRPRTGVAMADGGPGTVGGVAEDLAHDTHLREMPPDQAAVEWLRPISTSEDRK